MTASKPDGYLALPASGRGSPVLVLHAWWGLNDTMKAFCRQLAEAGFVVFAPDLYHGRLAEDIPGAEALSDALDVDQARADISGAVELLVDQAGPAGQQLAVVGFSLGAFFALELSVTRPELVRSVVVYYGTRPGDYAASQASYLGHFAADDPYEPPEMVEDLEEALKLAHRPVTFHPYPGTGHWFCEPDRDQAYRPAAAQLAWERTLAFLWHSTTG